ncbi:type II toxin-antitoxin system HicB family antitoxin [Glaesserella parasuis]|uniref:type II toxin-antitoxin system HicB family antitoxin n=1 Tax=Glaesserella parasuis TaxID=738 RepID=UPI0021C014C2|nr:type II toxin-antitoxin system HicB family antitoxin [Glaesserella parasuis]MCT8534473.1 type II toxin-antitoxin system HicB family antitoxin [Glaesserella parasuis]MCT8746635.1 type II toxin-antitoxin system HicB family antitoxin [Glaesserella parasuis]MCT8747617.1 type II toxin-antitoxin system HicB family antitoxin [Glaesserella parasuis]MCT8771046.1 type II toxin-antitoxin system HicB family antitoxin [Glaesserella parasuis]MCT8777590.1 type II toxin-antitoxin system HicB family antitox
MLRYPVEITKDDNNTYLVTCPDIPEMASVGEDIEEALLEAKDGLAAALEFYFDDRRTIPLPSPTKEGQHTVDLSILQSMKVFLLNEMIKQDVRKAEMARRLDVHLPQIDRLLDFKHATKVEFVEKAYSKLNRHFTILPH